MRVIISGPARWSNKSKRDSERADLVKMWLRAQILILQKRSPLEAASSLHLGLDTFFAALCLQHGIPLHAILACKDQDLFWGPEEREVFNHLSSEASEVVYTSDEPYASGCIARQSEAITSWATQSKDSALLLIRWGPLSKTQRERLAAAEKSRTLVKTGRF